MTLVFNQDYGRHSIQIFRDETGFHYEVWEGNVQTLTSPAPYPRRNEAFLAATREISRAETARNGHLQTARARGVEEEKNRILVALLSYIRHQAPRGKDNDTLTVAQLHSFMREELGYVQPPEVEQR